jgi:polygalacturonase
MLVLCELFECATAGRRQFDNRWTGLAMVGESAVRERVCARIIGVRVPDLSTMHPSSPKYTHRFTPNDNRPNLLQFDHSQNLEIANIHLRNSPNWNFFLNDVRNVHVHDVTIITNIQQQRALLRAHGRWDVGLGIPTFPLNTDGIDIVGINVIVENVYVENFDDSVVVKPSNAGGKDQFTNCSENILVG